MGEHLLFLMFVLLLSLGLSLNGERLIWRQFICMLVTGTVIYYFSFLYWTSI